MSAGKEKEEEEVARLVRLAAREREQQIEFAERTNWRSDTCVRGIKIDRDLCRNLPWRALHDLARRVADGLVDLGFPALSAKTEILAEDHEGDCGTDARGTPFVNTWADDCPVYTLLVHFYVRKLWRDPEPEKVLAGLRSRKRGAPGSGDA